MFTNQVIFEKKKELLDTGNTFSLLNSNDGAHKTNLLYSSPSFQASHARPMNVYVKSSSNVSMLLASPSSNAPCPKYTP